MANAKNNNSEATTESWKIGQVVEQTELSKELIHHYLRQGMLPPSLSRGRYDSRQIQLLQLIKRLREDRHLPLESIRGLFEAFDFDPGRLSPLVLGESLPQRIAQLTEGANLALSRTLSIEDVATASGISVEAATTHVEQGLIVPLEEKSSEPRFTPHDAHVVALAEHGKALGVPYESFRTIASYVRVAFELEHHELFGVEQITRAVASEGDGDPAAETGRGLQHMLNELFLRRELIASFVQNNFHSMTQRFLKRILQQPAAPRTNLDGIVFRPSPAFVQRHGIGQDLDGLGERLAAARERGEALIWFRAAETYVHAGRYREAVFFLEQALEHWSDDPLLTTHYGMALVLAGEEHRGRRHLEHVVEKQQAPPLAKVLLALSMIQTPADDFGPREAAKVLELAREALAVEERSPYDLYARIFAAWLLTALPSAFRCFDEGVELLRGLVERIRSSGPDADHLPGLHERFLINAAYLLFEFLEREEPLERTPALEQLRAVVCRMDPGSAFAREVFLRGQSRSVGRASQ